MSVMTDKKREDAREQATGRFGEQVHTGPESTLGEPSDPARDALNARREQLRALGFVPAAPQLKSAETTSARVWWERTNSIAEKGQYETMPRRNAKLRTYSGVGTSVKMPSAAAVRRFASEHGTTFDVPVEANTPHGPVTGHVRVTKNGRGKWSVSAVGMPPGRAEYVSESVLATLEARRPSRALSEVRDILAQRRERIASQGAKLKPVPSGWIRGVGYNPHEQQLVMNLQGRMYGYHVDQATYDAMMSADSIGRAYNYMVKQSGAERFDVVQHEACGNYHYKGRAHRCPSSHDPSRLG